MIFKKIPLLLIIILMLAPAKRALTNDPSAVKQVRHPLSSGGPRAVSIDPTRDEREDDLLLRQPGPMKMRNPGDKRRNRTQRTVEKWNGASLCKTEDQAANPILNDFQVNENVGRCDKQEPSIAVDVNGNFVLIWIDMRNGYGDINGQRYNSSGTAIGSNFRINDDYGNRYLSDPSIAIDGSGNFIVVWVDYRSGNSDIYGQRYNSSGTVQGGNFLINNDAGGGSRYDPSVAMDESGNFTVVWYDYRNGNSDIYGQRYNSSGTAQGSNFLINEVNESSQLYPSVSTDGNGNFTFVWQDNRNGNYDIYGQRYNSSGTAQGSNFLINDESNDGYQGYPSVSSDDSGNFTVIWLDDRNDNYYDLYGQRFNSNGIPLSGNFSVNDAGGSEFYSPSISMNAGGSFVLVWGDARNGDIYGQRYSSSGTALGVNFRVNDDTGGKTQYHPAVAMDGSRNFIMVWQDYRNGNSDIYGQRYNSSGTVQGSNFLINDDAGSSWQFWSSVVLNISGNFTIVWMDNRNGNWDIYGQRYNSSGLAQGNNFLINDGLGSNDEWSPSIAMDGSGNFTVVWEDYRTGDWEIYGQRYNSNATAQGSNFRINNEVNNRQMASPSITMDGSGNYIVVWRDDRNGDTDIFGQRYNSNGTNQGGNFLINDDTDSSYQYSPIIAMDGTGNFTAVWLDGRNESGDIYGQRYDASGKAQGSNFLINDDLGNNHQESPSITMNGSGNFIVVWVDYRNRNSDIYGQRYDSNGVAQGGNFLINDTADSTSRYSASVSMDGTGNVIVVWTDDRNGDSDIYGQCYNSNGLKIGGNIKVSNDASGKSQEYPVVKLGNGRFVTSWEDNRVAGQGWDIFTNINQFPTDCQAPSIGHTPIITGLYGQSIPLSATITDNKKVSSATLYYRQGGKSSFSSVSMTNAGGDTYQGVIPSGDVTERGVDYRISATDSAGNTSTAPDSFYYYLVDYPDPIAQASQYSIQVSYSSLDCAYSTPANSYRMISIPGDADVSSPGSLLEDDFGTYDRTQWRLLRGQNGSYFEYTIGSIENFEPGNAFWLITKDSKTWDAGSGKSVSTASPYVISLTQGWNMIGNPFAFSVAWSDVVKHGTVEAPWAYEGTGNSTSGYIGSQTRLLPWKGYCVYNDAGQTTTIEIPAKEASGTAKASGTLPRALEHGEWTARIKAVCGSSSDLDNYAGCLADAEAEWDGNDFREAPPIGDYVSVVFPHDDWKRHSGDFAGDFRPVDGQGHEWNFTVRTGIPHAEVRLAFEGFDRLPQGWGAVLIDESGKQRMSLNKGEDFSFLSGSGESSRAFRLLVGGEEYVQENGKSVPEIPAVFQLLPNYPNPFNASTMISYTLPSQSPVSIEVYDVLGRQIAVLETGAVQEAGYHQVIWDGRDLRGAAVSSGIYVVHLKAGGFVQRRKVALTR